MKRIAVIILGLIVGLIAFLTVRTIVYPWRRPIEAGTAACSFRFARLAWTPLTDCPANRNRKPMAVWMVSQSRSLEVYGDECSVTNNIRADHAFRRPKENVLPSEARATVNVRIHPRDTVDSVVAHLRALFPNDPDIQIKPVQESAGNPTAVSSTESTGFRLIERAVRNVFPETIVAPYLSIVGTDSRHYTFIANAIYRFGPFVLKGEDLERIHGTNERISLQAAADLTRFYIRLLDSIE